MNKMCLVLGLLLSACSTAPVPIESARPAQQRHVYPLGLKLSAHKPDSARVTFIRDTGFSGSGCTSVIKINGEEAFALDAGEVFTIFLAPGDYFFTRAFGGGLCPNTELSQNASLQANEEQVYRLLMNSNMDAFLTRIK